MEKEILNESQKEDAKYVERTISVVKEEAPLAPLEESQLPPFPLKIFRNYIYKEISVCVQGLNAATATNYGTFFVNSGFAYEVISITEVHKTKGTNAGSVTLNVEKCTSGTAADSGVALLSTAFNLKANNDIPQVGVLVTNTDSKIIKDGDRLVLKDGGTLTDVADVCVTVILRQL